MDRYLGRNGADIVKNEEMKKNHRKMSFSVLENREGGHCR